MADVATNFVGGSKRAFRSNPSEDIAIKKKKKVLISDVIPAGCGSIEDYERLNLISRGSQGLVFRARYKKTGEIVAVKKELKGALSPSTLSEINILRSLDHPSVVGFKEVAADECGGVYVVMEYAEDDLEEYIIREPLPLSRVKRMMKEFLEGVEYLHDRCGVIHRDLKPSNILIDDKGKLKICDFGMSRKIPTASDPPPTNRVGTLWYKAPELLLGQLMYSAAIDMWSVGCIMAEFFLGEELFTGWSEIEQLQIIMKNLEQPRCRCLYDRFDEAIGPILSEAGFDLLFQLLSFNPRKRITASDALKHKWFHE